MKKFFRVFTVVQVIYQGYQMYKERKNKKGHKNTMVKQSGKIETQQKSYINQITAQLVSNKLIIKVEKETSKIPLGLFFS